MDITMLLPMRVEDSVNQRGTTQHINKNIWQSKWAITEKFQDYLYGKKFTVITDNNPLTYILSTAKLDATGHRWVAALAAFDFDILYRPGRNNSDADAPHDYLG